MPKVFVIAAGHGKRPDGTFDPGAINSHDKTREYDYNQYIRDYVITKLHQFMPTVTVYSDNGIMGAGASDPNWKGVLKYVDTLPTTPDLVLEIHHDYELARPAGFGIYPRTVFNTSMAKLSDEISNNYAMLGLPIKKSYADVRGLGLLRGRKYPSLIWECSKIEKVSTQTLNDRALGIAAGINSFFNTKINTKYTAATYNNKIIVEFATQADSITFYRELKIPYNAQGAVLDNAITNYKMTNQFYPSPVITSYVLDKMNVRGKVIEIRG